MSFPTLDAAKDALLRHTVLRRGWIPEEKKMEKEHEEFITNFINKHDERLTIPGVENPDMADL